MGYDKALTLSEAKEFNGDEIIKPEKTNEMSLVNIESFENVLSEKITKQDLDEMYAIAQEMVKFAHARGGVGLALPQIGINKRGFVFLTGEDKWEMMLNPEFFATGKKSLVYERSLSYEGVYAIPRFKKINAAYYTMDVDSSGEKLIMKKQYRMMSGLKAFVFQSLVEMLDGKTAHNTGVFINTEREKTENES